MTASKRCGKASHGSNSGFSNSRGRCPPARSSVVSRTESTGSTTGAPPCSSFWSATRSLPRWCLDLSENSHLLELPAEADLLDRRLKRAARQPRLRRLLRVVVPARSDVVGSVGREDRGEVLDLAPALSELGLAAAVGADAALLAVVVGGEEPLDRA